MTVVGSGLCILAQRLKHHHGSRPRISRLTVTEYLLYAVLLMLDDEPGKADTVRENQGRCLPWTEEPRGVRF